jgi:hypothetical protein
MLTSLELSKAPARGPRHIYRGLSGAAVKAQGPAHLAHPDKQRPTWPDGLSQQTFIIFLKKN